MDKIQEIGEKLKRGEDVGFVGLDDLYKVAEHLSADTSQAKRLRGRGFQSDALIDAIGRVLDKEKL